MYWRVHGNESKKKLDWLDLPLRMQKATSCRYLLILGIKLLLQKFDANLAISNPRYLELFFDTLESSRGSTVWSKLHMSHIELAKSQ